MTTNDRLEDLCQQALVKWGNDAQLLHTVQELTELSLEIQQLRYGKSDIYDVKYELADVVIMLNQLMLSINITNDELTELVNTKLDKLEKKIS